MYRLDGVYAVRLLMDPDPLKMCRGKNCVEKFAEHIEDEVKQLYATIRQQAMTENKACRKMSCLF